MKTLDLVPIPQSAKDPTFQAECGLIAKATVDKALLPTVEPTKFAEDYVSATPITIYSQKVQTGVYPTTETYGSEVRGPNPFAKTSEFSKPLSDHTKDPAYLC